MSVIKTTRLTLATPFLHEQMDVSHYLKWLNNPAVVQFSEQRHKEHTRESQYAYLCSFPASPHYFWEIQRNETPIGSISAYRDMDNRTANVGVLIGEPKHWGQGYACEAWEAVCEFLFDNGTRKIEAGCMASNHAMISVLRKTGFTVEATLPGHFLRQGKPEDMLCYGKTREAKVISLKQKAKASA